MLRVFLTVVLPLLLPLALFLAYLYFARRRAAAGGEPVQGWNDAPWPWFALAGVVLVVASLVYFKDSGGYDAGTELEPPRLQDGRIVPAGPKE